MYLLCSNKLSNTRARELIKETLSVIGIDSKSFMLHGRWRSEQAKNMYVEEPLESRLQLTRFFSLVLGSSSFFATLLGIFC